MDMSKCYCGIALTCPRHGPFEEPGTKAVFQEHGFWWVRNEVEDDVWGPFDTIEDAHAVHEEIN